MHIIYTLHIVADLKPPALFKRCEVAQSSKAKTEAPPSAAEASDAATAAKAEPPAGGDGAGLLVKGETKKIGGFSAFKGFPFVLIANSRKILWSKVLLKQCSRCLLVLYGFVIFDTTAVTLVLRKSISGCCILVHVNLTHHSLIFQTLSQENPKKEVMWVLRESTVFASNA